MFLKVQIKCRKTSGNLLQQKRMYVDNISINIDNDNKSIDTELSQCESKGNHFKESDMSAIEVETSTPRNSRKILKRRHENIDSEIINFEKKKLDLLELK